MLFLKLTLAFVGMLAATIRAAPTEVLAHSVSHQKISERIPALQCGQFFKIEEEGIMPAYANGHYENLEEFTHMIGFNNWSCGICVVFAGRDAQGDILWSGGPNQGATTQVRGGQSYYCISGALPPAIFTTKPVKTIDTRDYSAPAQGCGQYFDDRQEGPIDLLANGHYENLAPNTVMYSVDNMSCGICMIFKGRDAQGEILWSGGPGQGATVQVKGAQSYFCIYGDNKYATPPKHVGARHTVETSAIASLVKVISSKPSSTKSPDRFCGNYTAVPPGVAESVYSIAANGHYENTIDDALMTSFSNQECGFCVVFKGRDCTGDEMFWGGPGDHTNDVKGAQSYFCY